MKKVDVQGTKTWIVSPMPADSELVSCSKAITAIHGGKEALCPQTLGELTRTREVTERGCISSNDSVKAAGKMSYGDISLELLFDPTDAAGQAALLAAFEANTPVLIAFEAPDKPASGTNGTIVWTKAMITGDGIAFPANDVIGYNVTLSPYGGFNRCPAA